MLYYTALDDLIATPLMEFHVQKEQEHKEIHAEGLRQVKRLKDADAARDIAEKAYAARVR